MRIDLQNYEAFVAEYLDGQLSSEELQAMQSFLAAHPNIKLEIEALNSIRLQPESESSFKFNLKNSLKKEVPESEKYKPQLPISKGNYENFMCDYLDGSLPSNIHREVSKFLNANADLKEEIRQVKKISLLPNTNLLYPNPDELKKHNSKPLIVPLFGSWAKRGLQVAALLAVFLFAQQAVKQIIDIGPAGSTNNPSEQLSQNSTKTSKSLSTQNSETNVNTISEINSGPVSNPVQAKIKDSNIAEVKSAASTVVKIVKSKTETIKSSYLSLASNTSSSNEQKIAAKANGADTKKDLEVNKTTLYQISEPYTKPTEIQNEQVYHKKTESIINNFNDSNTMDELEIVNPDNEGNTNIADVNEPSTENENENTNTLPITSDSNDQLASADLATKQSIDNSANSSSTRTRGKFANAVRNRVKEQVFPNGNPLEDKNLLASIGGYFIPESFNTENANNNEAKQVKPRTDNNIKDRDASISIDIPMKSKGYQLFKKIVKPKRKQG